MWHSFNKPPSLNKPHDFTNHNKQQTSFERKTVISSEQLLPRWGPVIACACMCVGCRLQCDFLPFTHYKCSRIRIVFLLLFNGNVAIALLSETEWLFLTLYNAINGAGAATNQYQCRKSHRCRSCVTSRRFLVSCLVRRCTFWTLH